MPSKHTVRSYDEELRRLGNTLTQMGGLAESQLAAAVQAVVRRDSALAAEVVGTDVRVDELETEIDQQVMRLLALRQPVGPDLREIVSSLKIASDLERIADYAANVAKRSIVLNQSPPARPSFAIPRMAGFAQAMIKEVLDAYVDRDAERAVAVWRRDEELDEMYTSLFRELLTHMMEDARNITAATHLLFMAKNVERIGDHATNIAETVHFLVRGERIREIRPKADRSVGAEPAPAAPTTVGEAP
ncbi:MAG: phosphate signaling complex protein PhoU [Alphaproteobacteria bacterium]|nr:phosphate signaling complex protein PhoU [Alphaproteobacteria bacterium]